MTDQLQALHYIVQFAFPLLCTLFHLSTRTAFQNWSTLKSPALYWAIVAIHVLLENKYHALFQLLPAFANAIASIGFYIWLQFWGLDLLCRGLSETVIMVSGLPLLINAKFAHWLFLQASVAEDFVDELAGYPQPGLASVMILDHWVFIAFILDSFSAVGSVGSLVISSAWTLVAYGSAYKFSHRLQGFSQQAMAKFEDHTGPGRLRSRWSEVQGMTSKLDLQLAVPVLEIVVIVSRMLGTPGVLSQPGFKVAFRLVYTLSLFPPHKSVVFDLLLGFWMAFFFYEYLIWLLLLWLMCQELYLAAWST